jgi:hypothetical protein
MIQLKYIQSIGLVLFVSLYYNCSNEDKFENIEQYYFPIETLTNGGKVYEYKLIGDTTGISVFFKYEAFPQKDKMMFVTTQFNNYCAQDAIYTDEIVHNGALRESIRVFEYDPKKDTTYFTDLKVVSGNVFPFEVQDSLEFLYKVVGHSKIDTTETSSVVQKIMYLGKTTHSYNGKPIDAIDFSIKKTRTEKSVERGDFQTSYVTRERYADGLGLVYFTESINGKEFQFRLSSIMTMEEFTKNCEKLIYNDY